MSEPVRPSPIRAVTGPGDPLYPQVVRLYRSTFAKPLRDPDYVIEENLLEQEQRAPFYLLVFVESEQVLGYAMGHFYADENVGFLAYIAASPAARGKGVGSALYLAFMERCVTDAQRLNGRMPAGICLEAEAPPVWHDAEMEEECRRRLEFYRRLGAEPVPGVDYRLPVSGAGWRRFHLLYHPITRRNIGPRQARSLARTLLRRVYGIRHAEAWVS